MNEEMLPVEAIQERDVDLILLEELATDNLFCEWFVNELNLPKLKSVNGVWRSITSFGLGETDILFSYQSNNDKILVLLENKLDASFQDEQFERYIKRAENYVNEKECDKAFVVLVAPEVYCDNQSFFEQVVSYESIANRLMFAGTKRNLFKSNLLKIASEKLRRGYKPVNSIPVQKFWHSYWNYKESNYPDLIMKKPDIVPQNSDWPMLYSEGLENIVFYHKLGQGNTDATFKNYPSEIEFKIKELLPDKFEYVKHGKSFSIRVHSNKIDRTIDFSSQEVLVNVGLEKLREIKNWIFENKNNWEK